LTVPDYIVAALMGCDEKESCVVINFYLGERLFFSPFFSCYDVYFNTIEFLRFITYLSSGKIWKID